MNINYLTIGTMGHGSRVVTNVAFPLILRSWARIPAVGAFGKLPRYISDPKPSLPVRVAQRPVAAAHRTERLLPRASRQQPLSALI